MKTLIVYDKQGQLIFTQTNATEDYNFLVEDIEDNKEIIGVDISKKKCIVVDKLATTEEKEALKTELESKNNELQKKENDLLKLQADYADLVFNNLNGSN